MDFMVKTSKESKSSAVKMDGNFECSFVSFCVKIMFILYRMDLLVFEKFIFS